MVRQRACSCAGPCPSRLPRIGRPVPSQHAPTWPPSDAHAPHWPVSAKRALRWPPGESGWPASDRIGHLDAEPASSSPDRLDWLIDSIGSEPMRVRIRPFSKPNGASAASMPGLAGRFAAEWCRTGTSSRVNSLPRERGRTDGGVMVRRALLDRSDVLLADDEALPPSQPVPAPPDQVPAHWRGAGGRWLVWVARAIAWAVILLIGYRGILAIIDGRTSVAAASSTSAARSHPVPRGHGRGLRRAVRRRVPQLQPGHCGPAQPGSGPVPAAGRRSTARLERGRHRARSWRPGGRRVGQPAATRPW